MYSRCQIPSFLKHHLHGQDVLNERMVIKNSPNISLLIEPCRRTTEHQVPILSEDLATDSESIDPSHPLHNEHVPVAQEESKSKEDLQIEQLYAELLANQRHLESALNELNIKETKLQWLSSRCSCNHHLNKCLRDDANGDENQDDIPFDDPDN